MSTLYHPKPVLVNGKLVQLQEREYSIPMSHRDLSSNTLFDPFNRLINFLFGSTKMMDKDCGFNRDTIILNPKLLLFPEISNIFC